VAADEGKEMEGKGIEELLRVNSELAGELRSLHAERSAQPRSGQLPAARGVARLTGERDTLAAELRAAEGELEAVRAERDGLERRNQEMATEIARLRTGFRGLLRRARGGLLSRAFGAAGRAPRGR
jgi:predicted  nucleic acid-binding Zn-ribbon protein